MIPSTQSMAKAKYAGDVGLQRKAWEELAEKKYPEHVAWLVNMLPAPMIISGGENADAGDIAVYFGSLIWLNGLGIDMSADVNFKHYVTAYVKRVSQSRNYLMNI